MELTLPSCRGKSIHYLLNLLTYLFDGCHKAVGQVSVEQYVEALLFDALSAAEGVEADGYEKCRVYQISSGLPFAGQIIAEDDPSKRDSDRQDRGGRVKRPDVLEHVV